MIRGSCLCGGIRFEAASVPFMAHCHCSMCRKAGGAAFSANAEVASANFRWLEGRELLSEFPSSPQRRKVFCSRCGSPIYSRRTSLPDALRIRAGLVDQPLPVGPAFHQHVASKANWWTISDGIKQFPGAVS